MGGFRRKRVNVMSGVPQGSVWPVIIPPVHLELFSTLEIRLIGYSDHFTLMDVVPSSGVRVTV